ncbi:unnamed protein product (macronuclear) [Paramecium tetraurelia]|uniref:Nop domain-containing protein n=1 Tax=Paramecium tetraurelia TaxID=5888 RepID=A0CPI4_PARTE|nr:uncharacterized protein GSPATT00009093001 [Paramecium tetraurelia]CAK72701.1 unnamed protein product [Paramecium tetraurelia]|eukprot:XP_001440098.1 hypothetical protein (macronuclear) [Paramecium tetraurelia strain d4-2]
MLILIETPAGFALFQVANTKTLNKIENIYDYLQNEKQAKKLITPFAFQQFKDTQEALIATSKLINGKIPKKLSKFLEKNVISQEVQDQIAVQDKKLAKQLQDQLGLSCIQTPVTEQLFRGIKSQLTNLIEGLSEAELKNMTLGLAHGLSRYKLKFSTEKVDTMIIQAIALLDDLDKEINNYMMRLREWFGWHFPELGKIIRQITSYMLRLLKPLTDLSGILPDNLEADVKQAAEVSFGTEITLEDEKFILCLADQVIELTDYRAQLSEYLKNRMQAIAPNLTTMVGELVGARLISHAGSLVNLAKYPASTVQILGAEKALFKAIRTKHNTPKYGLIFQASLVGSAPAKLKGKVSRTLAAKTALCIRYDALGEGQDAEFGVTNKAFLEKRVHQLEEGVNYRDVKAPQRGKAKPVSNQAQYQEEADFQPQGATWMQKFQKGRRQKISTIRFSIKLKIQEGEIVMKVHYVQNIKNSTFLAYYPSINCFIVLIYSFIKIYQTMLRYSIYQKTFGFHLRYVNIKC